MTKGFYSMTIIINPDHRIPARFKFGRYFDIQGIPTFLGAVRTLKAWTAKDKKGRILCMGKVGHTIGTQDRLYVVKWGHDGKLWTQLTPLGLELRERFANRRI